MSSTHSKEVDDGFDRPSDRPTLDGTYLVLSGPDAAVLSFSHASGEHLFFRDGGSRMVHVAAQQFRTARANGDVIDLSPVSESFALVDEGGTAWRAVLLHCDEERWHFMLESSGEVVTFSDEEYEELLDEGRLSPMGGSGYGDIELDGSSEWIPA